MQAPTVEEVLNDLTGWAKYLGELTAVIKSAYELKVQQKQLKRFTKTIKKLHDEYAPAREFDDKRVIINTDAPSYCTSYKYEYMGVLIVVTEWSKESHYETYTMAEYRVIIDGVNVKTDRICL